MTIQVTQGLDVIPPNSGQAYPIPCDEWDFIKSKVSKIDSDPWFYQNAASVLAGASVTTLASLLLGAYPDKIAVIIAWAVIVVTAICSALCCRFAHLQNESTRVRANDVIAQMTIIEKRYKRTENLQPTPAPQAQKVSARGGSGGAAHATADGGTGIVPKPPAAAKGEWETVRANITDEAMFLLTKACEDKDGIIMRTATFDGTSIQVGNRVFNEPKDSRSVATWEHAIATLLNSGLITDPKGKNEIFRVAKPGYDLVDYYT